jgi:dienelactone hydrolase
MQKYLQREKMANGEEARKGLQLRLLTTDHLDDVIAGLSFLKKLPRVDANRIAIAGHSFGGRLTLLAAERDSSVHAAVTFGAAAGSWENWPELRQRLLGAVRKTSAPLMLIHASNDYSPPPATRWRQRASGWASHRSSKFIRQSARHRRKAQFCVLGCGSLGNRRL